MPNAKNSTLQNKIKSEYGNIHLGKIEIPEHITTNICQDLREYQIMALKYYMANNETFKKRHLMFNMATGSGKTLIMAALMLDSFKKGYENFIFFVNSNTILEKTKANFSNENSSKYLFAKNIIINNKTIKINIIDSLEDSQSGYINIYFTTIQNIYSLFTSERENAISLEDLKNKKFVFLADEAHHLNSETKKKLSKNEDELKQSWESIIKSAFNSHNENLMFEFTATIPKIQAVQDKYKDKIVYEYDLKNFSNDKYSKKIFLFKYDSDDLEMRFLGAVLLSVYRELVAFKNDIFLKPVILFKSEKIDVSKENHKKFMEFIENLDSKKIENFYKIVKETWLSKSHEFFKEYFKDNVYDKILEHIRASFKEEFIINTNEENEIEQNQILLNNLESKDNHKRIIFTVDRLNEGWDVLNLFDIVRLKNANSKSIQETTQEAQLIGRGARYFPFITKEHGKDDKYKRKFDNPADTDLKILEYLSYHTINEVDFINNLNKAIIESGLQIENEKQRIKIDPNEKLIEKLKNEKIFYAKNERIRRGELFKGIDEKELGEKIINKIKVPLFGKNIDSNEVKDEKNNDLVLQNNGGDHVSKKMEKIESKYFLKAMNKLNMGYDYIKENFNFESKDDFITALQNKRIEFNRKQFDEDKKNKDDETNLKIALYILENLKNKTEKIKHEYEVKEFKKYTFEIDGNMGERYIFVDSKDVENIKDTSWKSNKLHTFKHEWLYYQTIKVNRLEKGFINFIEDEKQRLDSTFEKWFIVRNDHFSEFKIYYDNQKSEHYAEGFEPDFVLFAKRKNDVDFFGIECFIEPKGEYIKEHDAWKEEFLKSINNIELDKALKLVGLKFFTDQGEVFENDFKEKLIENYKNDNKI